MKLFTAIALIALSLAASITVAEARSSTKDSQKPGLDPAYQKKFYVYTCTDTQCGNWNVK